VFARAGPILGVVEEAPEEKCGGTCHTIRGIDADVGPPLTGLDTRRMIAGRLPNTPANLALWISQPQSVDPGNAMPDTGLTRSQAAEIAAYLYAHP
jgi:cytochrome c1